MIKVYSTTHCAYCRQTKTYLKAKGVEFYEIDVSDVYNPEYQALADLYGHTVPLVADGSTGFVGWNLAKLNAMIKEQVGKTEGIHV